MVAAAVLLGGIVGFYIFSDKAADKLQRHRSSTTIWFMEVYRNLIH